MARWYRATFNANLAVAWEEVDALYPGRGKQVQVHFDTVDFGASAAAAAAARAPRVSARAIVASRPTWTTVSKAHGSMGHVGWLPSSRVASAQKLWSSAVGG